MTVLANKSRTARWDWQIEDWLGGAALLAMAVLPVLQVILRTVFATGLPGSAGYVQNLTLWVGFIGAMIAARRERHLCVGGGVALPPGLQRFAGPMVAAISVAVATGLFWACLGFVRAEMDSANRLNTWLPVWMAQAILPVAFAVVALRFTATGGGTPRRALAATGLALAAAIGFPLAPYASQLAAPAIVVLVLAGLFGAPIFIVMGGATLLLLFAAGEPVSAIAVETYRIVVSPAIATIPLFTLTGYLLAEGDAGRRLLRLFRALFGWMPGGLAVAATLVCAFFSTFTGASGITILALGGLLLPMLVASGYSPRFSVGLLTATGSIGLLFPPSLAVILYGVVAHIPIPDLFRAGIVPGIIMVGAVAIFGWIVGLRAETARPRFDAAEAGAALWDAKWEVLLPVIALLSIFGGFATLMEAAAITVVYALAVQLFVHRELTLRSGLHVFVTCVTLMGSIFVIIGVAMGLTGYLVDAEVPARAAGWVQAHVESRFLFLLALNLFLLVVGCLMDIFSAIVVVVPLIMPIGEFYGIHPLHLAIIFLVNLEVGYLTPPVGMNLFLASIRFERPLARICREILPFLLVLLLVVGLVTYVPAIIIGAG